MSEKRQYVYEVRPEHLDLTRRVTIKAIFDILLDTACKDAELNGFGSHDMATSYNLTWVLIRMRIDIRKQPVEDDTITVKTWVDEISKLSTTRNYQVYDQNGDLLVSATTLWTVIDLTTRRMAPVSTITAYSNIAQQEFGKATEQPARLKSPEIAHTYSHKVCYSDVDINRHAHSSNYLLWVVDTLPIEELVSERSITVEFNFLQEVLLSQEVQITRNDANPYLFELTSEGTPVCRIQIEWQ